MSDRRLFLTASRCLRSLLRIIGAIKMQFFHMVTYAFDNSNLSQEIFAIDTWGAVICRLVGILIKQA